MQAIFAYWQSKQSDYHIAIDTLKEAFEPNLNSMEVQDKDKLEQEKQEAIKLFEQHYTHGPVSEVGTASNKINNAVVRAIDGYHQQLKKDQIFYRKNMVLEAESITDRYVMILMLIIEFATHAQNDKRASAGNFVNNMLIQAIKTNNALEELSLRRNAKWSNTDADTRQWYKDILKKDESFQEYLGLRKPTEEDDVCILSYILKKVIFKNEVILAYLEDEDLNWSENKAIVKSMATKTVKSFTKENGVEPSVLSYNWDEDKEFFIEIFNNTINLEDEYKELIAKKTKNWDIDRIASLDRIILQMAICEMVHFPSIPVKVTINEYIEISKNYSTPKSKQFINGVLDVIAQELTKDGVLKKSGRGLIDNK